MAEPLIDTTDDAVDQTAPDLNEPVVEESAPPEPLDPVLVWHLIKLIAALILLPILLFKVL
ncbi:hypothetical protein HNQ59_000566 [Chitinivorax tropicus]|uniref:Uncharacterized protein n=1 Tax=Chitinivorax tropicus TaxID=714531 RepID=A0A840MKR7_9PROT|nr:hypothetical protein [Chitinivorax tropicus]MBB5017302.1 hypothetical protein [Chitinivorax tropicus]